MRQGGLQTALDLIDEYARLEFANGRHPGLAIAVTDREGLLRVSNLGHVDIVSGQPLRDDTLFEIGSISKSLTSLLVLQESEAGRLDPHAPVTEYLPWFRLREWRGPITAHHLMTHTAGLPEGSNAAPAASPLGLLSVLADCPAAWPPGERFSYSNAGYQILGLLLEEVTGRPIRDLLRERIFDPLGMDGAVGVIDKRVRSRLATGYERAPDDRPWQRDRPLVPATWVESATADGSIACTARDLAAYARLILNHGRARSGPLIGEASYRYWTGSLVDAWPGVRYGYGLASEEIDGHTVVNHLGGMIGYSSALFADVEAGIAAVVLMNEPLGLPAIAPFAVRALRAAVEDRDLPPLPRPRWSGTDDAADYAGVFRAPDGSEISTVTADGDRLHLDHGGLVELEPLGGDTFLPLHSDLDHATINFVREDGQVMQLLHGDSWLVNDRYSGPTSFASPPEWRSYGGLYRANNPWRTRLRINYRRGQLWLSDEPLEPLPDGSFRPAALPCDLLTFDTFIAGRPVRATLSGCHYYRVDPALSD